MRRSLSVAMRYLLVLTLLSLVAGFATRSPGPVQLFAALTILFGTLLVATLACWLIVVAIQRLRHKTAGS